MPDISKNFLSIFNIWWILGGSGGGYGVKWTLHRKKNPLETQKKFFWHTLMDALSCPVMTKAVSLPNYDEIWELLLIYLFYAF